MPDSERRMAPGRMPRTTSRVGPKSRVSGMVWPAAWAVRPSTEAGKKFIGGEPRKPATSRVLGEFHAELAAPIDAFMATRTARGSQARRGLADAAGGRAANAPEDDCRKTGRGRRRL